jgi:hypothetical protein
MLVRRRTWSAVLPEIITLKKSDTIQTALDKMIDSEEDIIPVLNAQGKILGDLRLSEILWFILRSK